MHTTALNTDPTLAALQKWSMEAIPYFCFWKGKAIWIRLKNCTFPGPFWKNQRRRLGIHCSRIGLISASTRDRPGTVTMPTCGLGHYYFFVAKFKCVKFSCHVIFVYVSRAPLSINLWTFEHSSRDMCQMQALSYHVVMNYISGSIILYGQRRERYSPRPLPRASNPSAYCLNCAVDTGRCSHHKRKL